ncbi:uncharacterized protein [Haliotis asinina]|uniref:uncharacterized protein n=1 Tax=Haliotis asinina TaxID=109174 RepID=UPI0035326060
MSAIFELDKVLTLINNSDNEDETECDLLEVSPVIDLQSDLIVTDESEITLLHSVDILSEGVEDCKDLDPDYEIVTSELESEEEANNVMVEKNVTAQQTATSDHNNNEISEENPVESSIPASDEGRSRKRKRNKNNRKKSIRKRMRQSGKEYVSESGRKVTAKNVKTTKDCQGKCKFKCAQKLSPEQRQKTFQSFWNLSDSEKSHFYSKTINREQKKRSRVDGQNSRTFAYAYHLFNGNDKYRVCKEFYLTTLSISQRRVSYFFENKVDPNTNVPTGGDCRGKSTRDRIPPEQKQGVRDHINSFPRVESHYCRASSRKEYLAQNLSLSTMYRLYREKCQLESRTAVLIHTYRNIFNQEFNLTFHVPKKDRCDRCEEYNMKSKHDDVDEELRAEYLAHFQSKVATKQERDRDREDREKLVVCFDLENVLSCPQANISSFFYRRKLSVYNLTAHCSLDSQGYCAIWNETQAGRGANEITSALISILTKIVEKHHPEHITLWSDSCVAQNRNAGITFALKDFMANHNIKSIEQKFCEPGHSSIQEVDAIHSIIERQLKRSDVYSPLGIVRCMKLATERNPLDIIQLRQNHFKKYIEASRCLNFTQVPFTKVKAILSTNEEPFTIQFKTSFDEKMTMVCIGPRENKRRLSSPTRSPSDQWPQVKTSMSTFSMTDQKAKDIRAMLKFMNPVDKKFMTGLLPKMRPR